MRLNCTPVAGFCRFLLASAAVISVGLSIFATSAVAQDRDHDRDRVFWPGNLVVSRSVYDNNPANVQVGEVLPPNCASTQGGCSA